MTRVATLGLALLLTSLATAANITESKVSWTPEPKERGTWGILSTCIFTLIICIWTVIHDDVIVNGTPFSRLLSKVQWMLYAFLAPESVIISAYKQWKQARDLHADFCKKRGIDRGSPRDSLGIEGAFFVIMGGFSGGEMDTIDLGDTPSKRFASRRNAFLEIVQAKGPVPKAVSRSLIADRGKADALGKTLALIQASSIVIQCLLRKIQGLTVTLLEFHVCVQVLCVALIYFFWWSKPQGVIEPILIIDSSSPTERAGGQGETEETEETEEIPDSSSSAYMIVPGEALVDIPTSSDTGKEAEGATILAPPALFTWSTLDEIRKHLKDWVSEGVGSWFLDLEFLDNSHPINFLIYAVYGAVHSIAWYSSFPTPMEQLLWRISCVSLVVTPLLFLSVIAIFLGVRNLLDSVIYIAVEIILLYSILCRAYLTVECFISLRLLPLNAYDTVVFERVWPSL
ncbi:hypothetical protein DFP73DRAFT_539860 [Morchella snyderi]|nr:hypothetical protein DFP73DRAFT_539860 [Morchella snyderi]